MTRNTSRVLVLGLLASMAGGALWLGACERPQGKPAAPAVVEPSPGDGVYTVRGRIERLPEPRNPRSALRIHHEHIPTFKGRDGNVHQNRNGKPGMLEMSMEFPVGPGVELGTLVPGDPVEFTFEVKWNSPPPGYVLTGIRRLPSDTKLELSGG